MPAPTTARQGPLLPLHKLSIGDQGIIQRVEVTGPVRRRFLDLGLVNGVTVAVVQVAPLGDPLVLEIRGYRLSMRKADAGKIWVERVMSNE